MSALAKAPTIIRKHIDNAIYKSIYEVKGRAQNATPVMTGALHDNWKETFRDFFGELQPMQPYAIYVHEGTGIYATSGTRAKKIPWVYKSQDGQFYTTRGQKATKFLQKGVDSAYPTIKSIFDRSLNDALEEIARASR